MTSDTAGPAWATVLMLVLLLGFFGCGLMAMIRMRRRGPSQLEGLRSVSREQQREVREAVTRGAPPGDPQLAAVGRRLAEHQCAYLPWTAAMALCVALLQVVMAIRDPDDAIWLRILGGGILLALAGASTWRLRGARAYLRA